MRVSGVIYLCECLHSACKQRNRRREKIEEVKVVIRTIERLSEGAKWQCESKKMFG